MKNLKPNRNVEIAVALSMLAVTLTVLGGTAYVAIHFISKFW